MFWCGERLRTGERFILSSTVWPASGKNEDPHARDGPNIYVMWQNLLDPPSICMGCRKSVKYNKTTITECAVLCARLVSGSSSAVWERA